MKFAKYWKEIATQVEPELFGRDRLSVWGASNESPTDASIQASSRLARFRDLLSNGLQGLRDYEYSNGFIREEVLEEIKSSNGRLLGVLTRNHYGAVVLNTDCVFFGDIDVKNPGALTKLLRIFGKSTKDKGFYIKKIEAFQKANPQFSIKVYETFGGLRVVILNELFKNRFELANSIFSELEVDSLFRKLCKAQSCYRARLTPKPWRVGLNRPLSRFPRSAVAQEEFKKWLLGYEKNNRGFSTTKHIDTFGSECPNSDIETVLMVHDSFSCTGQECLA